MNKRMNTSLIFPYSRWRALNWLQMRLNQWYVSVPEMYRMDLSEFTRRNTCELLKPSHHETSSHAGHTTPCLLITRTPETPEAWRRKIRLPSQANNNRSSKIITYKKDVVRRSLCDTHRPLLLSFTWAAQSHRRPIKNYFRKVKRIDGEWDVK